MLRVRSCAYVVVCTVHVALCYVLCTIGAAVVLYDVLRAIRVVCCRCCVLCCVVLCCVLHIAHVMLCVVCLLCCVMSCSVVCYVLSAMYAVSVV